MCVCVTLNITLVVCSSKCASIKLYHTYTVYWCSLIYNSLTLIVLIVKDYLETSASVASPKCSDHSSDLYVTWMLGSDFLSCTCIMDMGIKNLELRNDSHTQPTSCVQERGHDELCQGTRFDTDLPGLVSKAL